MKKTMTVVDAILRSLEELGPTHTSPGAICDHIRKHNYYDFGDAKTPPNTVYARCYELSKKDTRIRRVKNNGIYHYYLTKNEPSIDMNTFNSAEIKTNGNKKTFEERDLHKLLSTYLKSVGVYSKTVYHEESNRKDDNQIWIHPDMVGVNFLNLQDEISQNFYKTISKIDTFKINSYELKREINNDSELKKAYFQAVSNSSWANYGYLVALEISRSLTEELERLNQSFGIGVIELSANPYQSKILFQAKYRTLEFKTIDKLCKINKDFRRFIEQIKKLLTAEEDYYESTKKELNEICDKYFENNLAEIKEYCKEKNIPIYGVFEES